MKRDFFERRDALYVAAMSFGALSAQSSNPRLDWNKSTQAVREERGNLIHVAFPYLKEAGVGKAFSKKEEVDAMFDELEKMKAWVKSFEERGNGKPKKP